MTSTLRRTLLAGAAAGLVLAAFGTVAPELLTGTGAALARGGEGSDGGDNSGSDHDGGDDHDGGHDGSDDGGDDGGDDHGGSGSDDGPDHDVGDDHGGRRHGTATGGGTTSGEVSPVKVESDAEGIEVTYSDGTREEIEGGRYERKDATGRTVEERPATQADVDRLNALL